jgi:hypothetical protein
VAVGQSLFPVCDSTHPAEAIESAGFARHLPPRLVLATAYRCPRGEPQVISVDDPFERRDQRRPKNAMQANHEDAAVPQLER